MADQDDEAVALKIEQRADRFALVRDHKGQRTELMLMESDILALARIIPSYARALGRVDKLNPDADAGKQDEAGEALDEFVVAGGDAA